MSSSIINNTSMISSATSNNSLAELNSLNFGSSKNQKQIINKTYIPELIETIINSNREYFDLKDNSVYLSNIIKIYQFKTKVLLEDVTGTILHLRNLFKSTNSSLVKNKVALSVAEATSKDVNRITALKTGNLTKYLSNKTTLKLNKSNLVKDTLDTFSLFQYGDIDSLDDNLNGNVGVEIGRKFDNNTQESSNNDFSIGDIELGRGIDGEEYGDISGINSLNSESNGNDPLMHDDGFGFHNDMDAFEENHGEEEDGEDGDFSLEQPRALGDENNNELMEMDLEIDDMQLNLNTPPDSPRGKISFNLPQKNRFVRNYNLQPVIVENTTEIPKRVFEKNLKTNTSLSNIPRNTTNKANKRFLDQLYSTYELQTLSLVSLRKKKQRVGNENLEHSSFANDNDNNDGFEEGNNFNGDDGFDFGDDNAADVSLGLDEENPNLMTHETIEQENDLQLMDTNSERTFNSVSSYLTSATPEMRAQREKDHIQQDLILSKTKKRTNFNDLFADENMNKKDISQLFLQVLNLSSESKINVEQIGTEIFVSQ